MKKRIFAIALALVSLCALWGSSVPGSLAFIVDRSGSIVNTFAPDPGLAADTVDTAVNVQKTVINTGKQEIGPDGFRFVLKNMETGQERTAVSNSLGFASFPLSFSGDQAGRTFSYALYELDTGRSGVTYSDLVYTVEIALVNDDGLRADVRINGAQTNVAAFRNVYNSDHRPAPPDTGDSMNPAIYAAAVLCALLGLAALLCTGIRKGGAR